MPDEMDRLTVVFQDVFDDDELLVTRDTKASDVAEWDSLMHVNLILAVEREFDIRFSSMEVASLIDVGHLADLVDAKNNDG